MQLETAVRSPALAMQLSNEVKTLVLLATNVPKRTANTMAITSARTPHTIPAMACPEFVAPLVRPRVTATIPRTAATRPPSRPRGNKLKDTAATGLATPRTRAATPRPFPGRADGGATNGGADPGTWVAMVISPVVAALSLDGREFITAATLATGMALRQYQRVSRRCRSNRTGTGNSAPAERRSAVRRPEGRRILSSP